MSNYAMILAAGGGLRMGANVPKQYLPLLNKPLIFHTIDVLSKHPLIDKIFVLLSPIDTYFNNYNWREFEHKLIPLFCGGNTRAETVLNGLNGAKNIISAEDWVLVHDAVRPCLDLGSVTRLIEGVQNDEVGGILALPVVDTLKRAGLDGRIISTQPRDHLWRAQTPQMFRYKLLIDAHLAVDPKTVTDEAGTIEQLGYTPKLVMGNEHNIKVTYPDDLIVAENNLERRKITDNYN